MKSGLFVSLFFIFQKSFFSIKISDEFAPFIKHHTYDNSEETLNNLRVEDSFVLNNTIIPLGWIQGIQYYNSDCSGTSFVTTNIAMGVCVKDGDNSSYIQYFVINQNSNPTTYEFYIDTFSDDTCTTILTHTDNGWLDPSFICHLDNGNDGISKTVYYYPGETPPPYPYNGVLTSYLDNNLFCNGTILKSVILNPNTCYLNYKYNESDVNMIFQSYQTQCDITYSLISIFYLDTECSIPTSLNNSIYFNESTCQSATQFRNKGLPEMYMVDDQNQFNYENVISTCYMGPTVFLKKSLLSHMYDFILNIFHKNHLFSLYNLYDY